MLHAVGDVIAQDFFFDLSQSGANCRNLRHHVDAIAVFLNHARKPADLTFDPVEAFCASRLDLVSHAGYIPP